MRMVFGEGVVADTTKLSDGDCPCEGCSECFESRSGDAVEVVTEGSEWFDEIAGLLADEADELVHRMQEEEDVTSLSPCARGTGDEVGRNCN